MTIDDEKLRLWLEAAVESAFRAGAAEERAAVVAWLDAREEELNAEGDAAQNEGHRTWAFGRASEAARAALAIERGEHRREEER